MATHTCTQAVSVSLLKQITTLYTLTFLLMDIYLLRIRLCLHFTYILFNIVEVIASGDNNFRGFAVQSRTSTNAFDTNAAFQGGFDNVDSDPLWQLIACTGVCIQYVYSGISVRSQFYI